MQGSSTHPSAAAPPASTPPRSTHTATRMCPARTVAFYYEWAPAVSACCCGTAPEGGRMYGWGCSGSRSCGCSGCRASCKQHPIKLPPCRHARPFRLLGGAFLNHTWLNWPQCAFPATTKARALRVVWVQAAGKVLVQAGRAWHAQRKGPTPTASKPMATASATRRKAQHPPCEEIALVHYHAFLQQCCVRRLAPCRVAPCRPFALRSIQLLRPRCCWLLVGVGSL